MKRTEANRWIDDAQKLFVRIGYADIDAFDAVRDIIQKEIDATEDPEMEQKWSVVANVFEGIYRKAVGR